MSRWPPPPSESATAPPSLSVEAFSADWVLPIGSPPIRDGTVRIEAGRIAAVGPARQLGWGRRYPGAVILPGFVNAHAHLEYAVYAGFGDGLPFPAWMETHVSRKRRIGLDDAVAIARLGAAQCLASGVTTVADASFTGAGALACAELGLRAVVFLEVFGTDPGRALERFRELRERVEPALSDGVRLGVSPHAPYTCSARVYEACAELELPLATHLSETEAELEWLRVGTGPLAALGEVLVPPPGASGVRLLAELQVLGPLLSAAHCVHLDAHEIALLAASGAGVVHCPRSNAFLGCGIAPVADLLAAGARVGLGTDSPASVPSFDVFAEMRAAVALARLAGGRPQAMPAARALELATLGSARALGLGDEVGTLEPGKLADLAIVSLEETPFVPWEDPATAVVLGGSPERVVATVVDGEVRYERETWPWHELQQRGSEARGRLLGL